MRRAVVCATLLVVASAVIAAVARQAPEGGRDGDGVVVTMRGCVSGSLLKSAVVDFDNAPGGSLASGERYRMIGSKEMKAQIKKANKALVQITGRIKPGPQSVVKGTKMGGTSIGIGVAPGSGSMDQQPSYTPTIEVDAIAVIAKSCE